jgi:hypothetical protein
MKPWFEREAKVIKFPEPEKKVVQMPNVASYPDFITGVSDLKARMGKGEISQASHDKLYTDLIHRFMRKESFETPWFLREAPGDQPTDLKTLAKQISTLPADTDPRIIDKIVTAIEMARSAKPGKDKGSRKDSYTRIKDPLKQVGELDTDMAKSYRYVAKQMLGNNLTSDEIFKQIIPAIQQDKCINLEELTSLRSNLSKIIPTYGLSRQTAFFYTDLLMTQPGQGVGPGEVLFSVFSQSIKKGGKGDLTLKSGKGIEVKGADEASGKGAGRMRDADLEKVRNPAYAKLAADVLKKFPTDKATGIGLGSAGIMGLMKKFPKQRNYLIDRTIKLFDALFPQGGYSKEFKQALEADDVKNAHYYYGLSNMQQYHIVKASGGQDQAYLFVDTANSPATTTYIDSFADGLAGLKKGVLKMKIAGSPYIVAKVGREKEAYPKVSLYPAK